MVGAGLSLNAIPSAPAIPPFPSWFKLVGNLLDELYPASGDPDARASATDQSKGTSGMLRMAQEYEAAFGRAALDQCIIKSVPDLSYEPSPLHTKLLQLPWSDVFTTNYDTLLERCSRALVDRRYDIVETTTQIPDAMKPRIVKLHGTMPATRPFIVAEEDFRTYPSRFAAFVNMTQQAIMENVFCLIGFSGDDPNFLYWSGWVRDRLGSSAPIVYLCGILNLTAARRQVLRERNVVPIDLSPKFPLADYPDTAIRHYAALDWLLDSLATGRPPNPMAWPVN